MSLFKRETKKIGDCDGCTKAVNCEVYLNSHNMWLCEACTALEKTAEQNKAARSFVSTFRQVDASINVEQDLFNAKTVAAIEARGAILQNTEIADTDKEAAFTEICRERYLHFKQVVSALQSDLKDAQNEMTMWQTQGQVSAGRLSEEVRAKYQLFDVTYQPVKPKTVKPAKPHVPAKSGKVKTKEAKEAAAKYNVDYILVAMGAESKNISAEEAAKDLAETRARMQSVLSPTKAN